MENDPEKPKNDVSGKPEAYDLGLMRSGSEFIGAIFAAAFLGWLLDLGLGTKPWGLLVFIVLGFCGGIWKIGRSLK